ncbi:MAG: putative bifunctional diguanylate cyclase/phosphodiesterase [Ectothiorhodospira sp.]
MESAQSTERLRGPILWAIAVPVGALLILAGGLVADRWVEARRLDRVVDHAVLVAEVQTLVEALQAERGASAGYLRGRDNEFQQILEAARATTDDEVSVFLERARESGIAAQPSRDVLLERIREDLDRLAIHRGQVDRLSLHPLEILPPYTRLVRRLVILSSAMPGSGSMPVQLDAYRMFLLYREYSGLERALGSAWLGPAPSDPLIYRRYVEAVSVQEFLRTQFLAMAMEPRRRALEALEDRPAHQELLAARAEILNHGSRTPPDHLSAVRWFRVTSDRLRQLGAMEQGLIQDFRDEARAARDHARHQWRLLGAGLLALLAVTVGLTAVITRRLLRRDRERSAHARHIEHLAHHDPLTDLPNRRRFTQDLQARLETARGAGTGLALLLLDLEGFSEMNRIWGEEVADEVLKVVAQRLLALAGQGVLVARIYGDQFALLLVEDACREDLRGFAARVLEVLEVPLQVGQRLIELRGNLGLVPCPPYPATASDLLADAAFAVEHSKASAMERQQVFDPAVLAQHAERVRLGQDLEQALDNGELQVHYQPQLDLATGRITSLEALLRWTHPVRGSVSPAIFIPLAEANGCIIAMGEFVLHEACRQLQRWRGMGFVDLRIAVNLSTVQLYQADLVEQVRAALEASGLPAGALELELTETGVMQDLETAMQVMQALRDLGVKLSLDDFGTGYASLAYLTRLPVQTLKLDRSFVADLETSGEARKVAEAVLGLAESLSLEVVAEGIETDAQADWLRERACGTGQGFLFSRPLPPGPCESLLEDPHKGGVAPFRDGG